MKQIEANARIGVSDTVSMTVSRIKKGKDGRTYVTLRNDEVFENCMSVILKEAET